mgnify:CR=1 FL=1
MDNTVENLENALIYLQRETDTDPQIKELFNDALGIAYPYITMYLIHRNKVLENEVAELEEKIKEYMYPANEKNA